LLKAAEGDPGEYRSPFWVHRLRIERSHTIIMLTQPSRGCEVHAAHGYLELLSKPEPVGTSVNVSVCIVNSHRIPHVQLLPCHFKASVSRLENVLVNSFIP